MESNGGGGDQECLDDDSGVQQEPHAPAPHSQETTGVHSPSTEAVLFEDTFHFWNPRNWDVQTGTGSQYGLQGWGNLEAQHYTGRPENLSIQDGRLAITARLEEECNWPVYGKVTSARIRTYGCHAFCPGDLYPTIRIEARIKVPQGQGLWPAFWLLPEECAEDVSGAGVYGGWAASGEIDVMEAVNSMEAVYASLHFGGEYPDHAMASAMHHTGSPISDGFHVYAVEWSREQLKWFFDSTHYFTCYQGWHTQGPNRGKGSPFDRPFHILLNLAVGGKMPNVFDEEVLRATLAEPKQMLVDWVRVVGITGTQEQ